MPEPPVKYMDIQEFQEEGYLQEVNRRFFHPLGLALEITVDPVEGRAWLSGIWDDRDDLEGTWYGGKVDVGKAQHIDELWDARRPVREAALGFMIEPAR